MSVLLIDAGNTRLEWRYRLGHRVEQGVSSYNDLELPATLKPKRVLVASVSGCQNLQQQLERHYPGIITWLDAPLVNYPHFKHCYKHPQRLGVDRWLAMLGARQHHAVRALVVDAGTALTVDALDREQHVGGYIVPGLIMAEQALFQGAQKVNRHQDESRQNEMAFGQDTLACVAQGLLRQRLSFIADVRQQYPEFTLFITGGDGMLLAQQLQSHYYHNLVLDGMDLLCAGFLSH